MAAPPAGKWKSDKVTKREAPGMLEPLDYKPTPKEDIDTMQISKLKPNRDGTKYIRPRPMVLESLGPPSQYDFVTQQPRSPLEETPAHTA